MSERRGCFKNGCFGCLGLLAILIVFVGINAVVAVNRNGDEKIEDAVLASSTAESETPFADSVAAPDEGEKPASGHGWLILELGQGDFELHQGQAGEGVVVKANYDSSIARLEEFSHTWPDSSWVYHVRFERTIGGMQALMREVMGGIHPSKLHIYIPPDLPIELNVLVKEGGMEAELGGLWLTDIDLRYNKGGISFSIDEPLREPVGTLAIHGRMGGGDLSGLGNASPQVLDVNCAMGGMSVGLNGNWRNDCDARLRVSMGGLDVAVPDNIALVDGGESGLRRTDAEVTRPVLRVQQNAKMGEIEIR